MASRILSVVYNDRESEARTPSQPLVVIPIEARDPFSAAPILPAVHRHEADLTRIAPGRPLASGLAIVVRGRVLDEDGRPVRRSLLEVWNANTYGRYSHTLDSANNAPLDPYFYGFGRTMTDDDGVYQLRTIKPGAYIARPDIGWWRPPHVHFSILGGARLVTQMYFPGEALNKQDFIHMTVPEAERPLTIATALAEDTFEFNMRVRSLW